MRQKLVYCLDCICGQHIESETTTLTCPGCQRLIEIQWPARETEELAPEQRKKLAVAA